MSELVRDTFKKIHNMDGLVTGHRQVFKYLERGSSKICFLASDCEEKLYVDIVERLCKAKNVKICRKFTRKTLGELTRQVRRLADSDNVVKVVPASACVIHTFPGMKSEECANFVKEVLDEK